MVSIRFHKVGKPHAIKFRLVAVDSHSGPKAPPLQVLGFYDPKAQDGEKIKNVKKDRLDHFLKVGAQLSDSVQRLLKKEKIL